ncbi:MAG: hypothetical protein ACREMA_18405 [Longimicrobiales bacterium]
MNLSRLQRLGILAALVIVLLGTRTDHFGPLPDATLAVFFLAGLYVGSTRWVLPLLLLCAVICDYLVITGSGQSFWAHHCVSVAYWFLVPAYASMWFGGRWLSQRLRSNLQGFALTACVLLVAFTLSFIFSNGSFYWLSGRYAAPHWAEFVERFAHYYPSYLSTTMSYAGFAALLHLQALLLLRYLPRLRPTSHPIEPSS